LSSISNDNQPPNSLQPTATVNLPANGNTHLVNEEAETGSSNLPSHSDSNTALDGNFDLNLNYNSELPAPFGRNTNDIISKRRRRRRRKKISSKYGDKKNPSISHHRDFNNLEPEASATQQQPIYKGGSDYLEDDFMGDFDPTTGRTQDFRDFMF